MRKLFLTTAAILVAGSFFYSCSDSENGSGNGDVDKILEYPYSKLTTEDQKRKLVNDGKEVSTQITGVADESSMKALYSLTEIAGSLISLLEGHTPSLAKAASTEELVVKLSKYTGAYTWNSSKEEWKKDADADNLVLVFPAYKGDTKTQGKLELTATASGVVIDNNEIPSKIEGTIYVADKKEGSIAFTATGIDKSKIVETAGMNISLGSYKLTADINKKGIKNEVDLGFSNNSTSLISGHIDLAADVTVEMIDKEDVSSLGEGNFSLVLSNDIALVGYVDVKSLITEENRIKKDVDVIYEAYDDARDALWEEYANDKISADEYRAKSSELSQKSLGQVKPLKKEQAELYNKYTNIALASISEKHKIASLDFELNNEEWDEYGWFYGDYKIMYLKFNDETRVKPEVFFGEGFTGVANIWEGFIEKFQ